MKHEDKFSKIGIYFQLKNAIPLFSIQNLRFRVSICDIALLRKLLNLAVLKINVLCSRTNVSMKGYIFFCSFVWPSLLSVDDHCAHRSNLHHMVHVWVYDKGSFLPQKVSLLFEHLNVSRCICVGDLVRAPTLIKSRLRHHRHLEYVTLLQNIPIFSCVLFPSSSRRYLAS